MRCATSPTRTIVTVRVRAAESLSTLAKLLHGRARVDDFDLHEAVG